MNCPKCEIGILIKIRFKKTGDIAWLCEDCSSLWLEGERISLVTGHTLLSYSKERDVEYSYDEINVEDYSTVSERRVS